MFCEVLFASMSFASTINIFFFFWVNCGFPMA
jgi:hypothetical protein